jgi:hypothetical protein
MLVFGLVLVGLAIVLYGLGCVGAILADRHTARLAPSGPFEWWKWFWEQLQKPVSNLTRARLKWFQRVVSLGSICLLIGVFLTLVAVATGNGGDNSGAGQLH